MHVSPAPEVVDNIGDELADIAAIRPRQIRSIPPLQLNRRWPYTVRAIRKANDTPKIPRTPRPEARLAALAVNSIHSKVRAISREIGLPIVDTAVRRQVIAAQPSQAINYYATAWHIDNDPARKFYYDGRFASLVASNSDDYQTEFVHGTADKPKPHIVNLNAFTDDQLARGNFRVWDFKRCVGDLVLAYGDAVHRAPTCTELTEPLERDVYRAWLSDGKLVDTTRVPDNWLDW